MRYVAISKADQEKPIVKTCIMAYGCMTEEKRKRVYLFPFGEHEIVAFLLRQEGIAYKLVKID